MPPLILAIDQGTTSSRALVFDSDGFILATAQQEFAQHFPNDGWVEHDPEEIWQITRSACCAALKKLPDGANVVGIGITNQRETTVVWNRETGAPIYPAIVWQDRRTAEHCRSLVKQGHEADVTARTGLLLDPYFSASKLAWILDNVADARTQAEQGKLAFGTIDSWLIWKLTAGKVHATDATNASRTMLFNIHEQKWDESLLALFRIPAALLPDVRDCAANYGLATEGLDGRQLPIAGVAGDQHAAMIGQACIRPGMIKSTYGTGCFALMNLGEKPIVSKSRLLTTVAYRFQGRTTYALEGAIFMAGATVQWLRDKLGIIEHASECEALAKSIESNRGVYLVPAFTGLGAPHWDPDARGVICGLTRDSGRAELVRAALEAVCYQTRDLLAAMANDSGTVPSTLRVDGGMIKNNWLQQMLADIIEIPVERPESVETTALGAARLAALQLGLIANLEELAKNWALEQRCKTHMTAEMRNKMISGWEKAVVRARSNLE